MFQKWNFEKLLIVTCGLTKVCFPVLHMDFPRLTPLIGTLFLASYNLTMYDKSHGPLVGAEVAWYNSYGPTKVPHTCDFLCVITT